MKIMRKKIVTYLSCLLILLWSDSVFAKKKYPPEPPQQQPGPPGLPIDGSISLLLIAGAAYGIYAIKKKNNVVVKRLKG